MPRAFSALKSGLNKEELQALRKQKTPAKIQDFLNTLDFDFGPGDEIDRSVRGVLKNRSADCASGAILAAAALWVNGKAPLVLDLKVAHPDVDHVVAVFKEDECYGALSKTNHAVLRYREPVYKSVRELAMSYFHEYFLPDGRKTLRSFSKPLDLSRYGARWLTDPDAVMDIIHDLDRSVHEEIASRKQIKKFRRADQVEIKAGEISGN